MIMHVIYMHPLEIEFYMSQKFIYECIPHKPFFFKNTIEKTETFI